MDFFSSLRSYHDIPNNLRRGTQSALSSLVSVTYFAPIRSLLKDKHLFHASCGTCSLQPNCTLKDELFLITIAAFQLGETLALLNRTRLLDNSINETEDNACRYNDRLSERPNVACRKNHKAQRHSQQKAHSLRYMRRSFVSHECTPKLEKRFHGRSPQNIHPFRYVTQKLMRIVS